MELPKTLNWVRPVALGDHRAGLLLLTYKLLVILPIVGFAAQLIDRARAPHPPDSPDERKQPE